MPNGRMTLVADDANADLAAALRERLDLDEDNGPAADILLTAATPQQQAGHVVVTGALTDELDDWDRQVPPQTLAGALWVAPDQDRFNAVLGWWLLRHDTPTTPLSDLTDSNERALRWSIVGVNEVRLPGSEPVAVDDDEIRGWLDEQPQVKRIGTALERVGGPDAQAVLASVEEFRAAMRGLDELAPLPASPEPRELDAAVAAHLREVQRSGFARWRGAKAREQTRAALVAAARDSAGQRLQVTIDARREVLRSQREQSADEQRSTGVISAVTGTAAVVELPCAVDFGKVPRSWASASPQPRRYVLVAEDVAEQLGELAGVSVRTSEHLPADRALCLVVQSGFSLPALR